MCFLTASHTIGAPTWPQTTVIDDFSLRYIALICCSTQLDICWSVAYLGEELVKRYRLDIARLLGFHHVLCHDEPRHRAAAKNIHCRGFIDLENPRVVILIPRKHPAREPSKLHA